MNGAQFIDLEEEDLGRMEINLKWRVMIMKAVAILRRETVRASRMELMHWEDGFDPEKDTMSSAASSYQGRHKGTNSRHVQLGQAARVETLKLIFFMLTFPSRFFFLFSQFRFHTISFKSIFHSPPLIRRNCHC